MRDNSGVRRDGGTEYFRGLRQHWLLVVVGLLVGSASAFAILQWAPREYRAETSVLVTPTAGGTSFAGDRSPRVSLDTEAQLVTASDTVTAAAERMGVPASDLRDIRSRVRVSAPANTNILDIGFTARSAAEAQRGSSMVAEAYLDQRAASARAELDRAEKALQKRIDEVDAQRDTLLDERRSLRAGPQRARIEARVAGLNAQLATLANQHNDIRAAVVTPGRIITRPSLPTAPSSPDRLVTLTAGIALGLLAGVGLAMARHRFDDRVRSADGLNKSTGIRVAAVLADPITTDEVTVVPATSADGRSYARLRNLVMTEVGRTGRAVVLVAGVRHAGSQVAVNLAVALARAGEDVVLLCADLTSRTPSSLLGTSKAPGLVEVLDGGVGHERAALRAPDVPNLRVLGPGQDLDRAAALLPSRGAQRLVDTLLEAGGYVVIETAAADSPDAQALARLAEAAVLVVELGRATSQQVLDAREVLESSGAPVLGAVVARHHAGRQRTARRSAGVGSAPVEDGAGMPAAGTTAEAPPAGQVLTPAVYQGASAAPLPRDSRGVAPR